MAVSIAVLTMTKPTRGRPTKATVLSDTLDHIEVFMTDFSILVGFMDNAGVGTISIILLGRTDTADYLVHIGFQFSSR